MNKKKKIFITACVMSMLMLAGCVGIDNTSKSKGTKSMNTFKGFTERQKEILRIKGWPEDIYELDTDQETEIYYTGKCYEYIENKYPDDKFEYIESCKCEGSYTWALIVRSEKLKDIAPIHVGVRYSSEEEREVFSDDYETIIAMDQYRNDIVKCFKDRMPELQIKSYMDTLALYDYEDINTTDTDWTGNVELYVPNVFENNEELERLMKETAGVLLEKYDEEMIWFDVFVYEESEFEKITIDYNSVYPQGTKKARSLYYRECIFKDGKLIIEGK